MKTNVPIELTDADREILANVIDRKDSKRKISRKEVIALCQQHIGGLLGQATAEIMEPDIDGSEYRAGGDTPTPQPLMIPDPEDIPLMKSPNDPSYVRGWNQVKRSA